MAETWKPITGYIGRYEVSDIGRVKNKFQKIMRSRVAHNGYLRIALFDGMKSKSHFLQRLVASAFIGTRPDGAQVNHKSGDKQDNRPVNLEYCTPSENRKHAYSSGLQTMRGENHTQAKLTNDGILRIREMLKVGMRQKEVAAIMGVCQSHISDINTGQRWSHIQGGT